MRFVPVPRIAITTPDYDFVFDDIVLNIRELTPKQIHLETLTCVHDVELERGEWISLCMHNRACGGWVMSLHAYSGKDVRSTRV